MIAHISRVLVKLDVVEREVLVQGCAVKPHLFAPHVHHALLVLIGIGVEFPHQREEGRLQFLAKLGPSLLTYYAIKVIESHSTMGTFLRSDCSYRFDAAIDTNL